MKKFIFSKQEELDDVLKITWDSNGDPVFNLTEEGRLLKEQQEELKEFVRENGKSMSHEIVQEGREFLQVWNEEDVRGTIQNLYFDYESELLRFVREVWR